jgi:4-hydroxyphenylacetate 3-monooxygenase
MPMSWTSVRAVNAQAAGSAGAGQLAVTVAGTGERLAFGPVRLVIGGYTGRDEAAVRAHIDELAAIGVPPPAAVPDFYELPAGLLTTSATIEVGSGNTSGEAEPVLLRSGGPVLAHAYQTERSAP